MSGLDPRRTQSIIANEVKFIRFSNRRRKGIVLFNAALDFLADENVYFVILQRNFDLLRLVEAQAFLINTLFAFSLLFAGDGGQVVNAI